IDREGALRRAQQGGLAALECDLAPALRHDAATGQVHADEEIVTGFDGLRRRVLAQPAERPRQNAGARQEPRPDVHVYRPAREWLQRNDAALVELANRRTASPH